MPDVIVGQGFDTASGKRKELGVFLSSMTFRQIPSTSFNVQGTTFTSTSDFERKNTTTIKFSAGSEKIGLDSALQFAGEETSMGRKLVYVLHIQAINMELYGELNQQQFAQDVRFTEASNELASKPVDFLQRYGDSFVSRSFYGKNVTLVVSFNGNESALRNSRHLEANFRFFGLASLDVTNDFFKETKEGNIQSSVKLYTEGFDPGEVPPVAPKDFGEIQEWLKKFEVDFKTKSSDLKTVTGFQVASYANVFASNANVIMDNVLYRAKYFFAMNRCESDLKTYIDYCQWANDDTTEAKLELLEDTLHDIRQWFDWLVDMESESAQIQLERLQKVIDQLNTLQLPNKVMHKYHTSNFGGDVDDGNRDSDVRVGQPFKFGEVPMQHIGRFRLTHNNQLNKPMRGELTFTYGKTSGRPQVIARILEGQETIAAIPEDVRAAPNEFHFAMQYTRSARYMKQIGEKFKSCAPLSTYATFNGDIIAEPKMLPSILPVKSPEPVRMTM